MNISINRKKKTRKSKKKKKIFKIFISLSLSAIVVIDCACKNNGTSTTDLPKVGWEHSHVFMVVTAALNKAYLELTTGAPIAIDKIWIFVPAIPSVIIKNFTLN